MIRTANLFWLLSEPDSPGTKDGPGGRAVLRLGAEAKKRQGRVREGEIKKKGSINNEQTGLL